MAEQSKRSDEKNGASVERRARERAGLIQRFELKYLIERELVDELRERVRPYCTPDTNNPGPSRGYAIHSLYCDSPDWHLYESARRNDFDRLKLRLRSYESGPAFLEVKRKVGEVISKSRVRVSREQVEDAAHGFASAAHPHEQRALEQFAFFVARLGAQPRVLISYEREAYVSTVDGYARLTFDSGLFAQARDDWQLGPCALSPRFTLDDAWHYDNLRSPTILELKCESRVPLWLLELIRQWRLERVGFSKYCFGAFAVSRRERGLDHAFLGGQVYV